MTQVKLLFATTTSTSTGEKAKLVAMQTPGDDRIALGIEIDAGGMIALRLSAAQAVGLAAQLCAANLHQLADFAQRMPETLALDVGAAFLANPALAALLRKATEGQKPQ